MRKWKTLAAKDDPNVWTDLSGMWPTRYGTYEVADFWDSGTSKTATGELSSAGTGVSAWAFKALTGNRLYVFATKTWEYSVGTLTDRTNAVPLDGVEGGHACQYGDITIACRGTNKSLVSSSGGNFSALAGSPSAKIVCVQRNAVLAFNTGTNSDAWHASDVGDYTNWATGEAASGRILDGNGPITAAVPFGDDVIVFKADCIFRMYYVGGDLKWAVEKICEGVGCYGNTSTPSPAVACGSAGIFFLGPGGSVKEQYFFYDGSAFPRAVSSEVVLNSAVGPVLGCPMYDPDSQTVCVASPFFPVVGGLTPYFYNVAFDAWGAGVQRVYTASTVRPLITRGDQSAVNAIFSNSTPLRPFWATNTDVINLYAPVAPGGSTASAAYIIPSRIGSPLHKTTWRRLVPLLRRRAGTTSPSTSLVLNVASELHGTMAAAVPPSVVESTQRNRFDFLVTHNYLEPVLTFTNMDAEIDDIAVDSFPAGRE